jgi:peptidoglycan/xylan/chitin deacetylase (PgdA/CDA1 family)
VRPVDGALVISLDFELFWGMRDVVSLDAYRANVEGVHRAVPRMLDLFAAYDVHATWACVGLLLARDTEEARHFAPKLRPAYHRRDLSPYDDLERRQIDADARCYFAPHLVREIASRPHQELATHTFAHFYCTEPGQSAAEFDADLRAAIAIAEAHSHRPVSIVFPRNQCNASYLPVLRDHGIRAYRGVPPSWVQAQGRSRLGVQARRGVRLVDAYVRVCRDASISPQSLSGDPIDIPGSRFLRACRGLPESLDALRLRRLRGEMTRAAKLGRVYHLWWHPHNFGVHTDENLAFLERLLVHARRLHDEYGFRSATMAEISERHAA